MHLDAMHKPLPGGSAKEAMAHKEPAPHPQARAPGRSNFPGGIKRVPRSPERNPKVAPAWVPGGYAQVGEPVGKLQGEKEPWKKPFEYPRLGDGQLGGDEPLRGGQGRGPHMGFRPDYHRYKAYEGNYRYNDKLGESHAAVQPEMGKGLVQGKGQARPFLGVYGARADRLDAWQLKKPAGGDPWVPAYPKPLAQNGPFGMIAVGHARVGPDAVGPKVEFKERRVDQRGHARGHEYLEVERVGIFPRWGPTPSLAAERHAGAPPHDPEDAARAGELHLNDFRLECVWRAWAALDEEGTGKVALDKMLARLSVPRYRKQMDQWRRDDVPAVSRDDLAERLAMQLVSLLRAESRNVKNSSSFMPSAAGRASRNNASHGTVRLREFERCYERLGCMVHDDTLFDELVSDAWGTPLLA
eukprot:CAMPEP_0114126138 /NCGR_PEP_ID=MMETSP0043_2-20121206/9670_1 /TAXON_ID=464988 /ORGANISM="Hemiselmis andersenii, Strain CCMP644" /LENGTH=412 /DNA_ID=CAMNT_0001219103 /DNA_START=268 /DNA_END=1503 /DNA_ORIENTATION=-